MRIDVVTGEEAGKNQDGRLSTKSLVALSAAKNQSIYRSHLSNQSKSIS